MRISLFVLSALLGANAIKISQPGTTGTGTAIGPCPKGTYYDPSSTYTGGCAPTGGGNTTTGGTATATAGTAGPNTAGTSGQKYYKGCPPGKYSPVPNGSCIADDTTGTAPATGTTTTTDPVTGTTTTTDHATGTITRTPGAYTPPSHKEMVMGNIKAIFQHCDNNHNGKLSIGEVNKCIGDLNKQQKRTQTEQQDRLNKKVHLETAMNYIQMQVGAFFNKRQTDIVRAIFRGATNGKPFKGLTLIEANDWAEQNWKKVRAVMTRPLPAEYMQRMQQIQEEMHPGMGGPTTCNGGTC